MNNQKKKIFTVIGIIIAAVFLFLGVICIQINGDSIAKNTYVSGVDVGGLNKSQAVEKLKNENKLENIKLTYEDKNWDIEPSKVEFSYDIEQTVNDAYELTRNGSFIENLIKTITTNFGEDNNIQLKAIYNEELLKTVIMDIAKSIDVDVVDANININGSQINIDEEQDGKKVNLEKTMANIRNNAIEGIFTNNIEVDIVNPKITKEQLGDIDTVLGSYSTKVTGPVTGRHTNIRLATERTSDVLLMPGDTFSYNEHTGLRSAENGYQYAPVIVQGVLQEGLGGGVCQVSSTLFNATMYAGLEYIQLRNHTIPSGYVEMGRDAVVSDTGLDFVFKNNLQHPIYIKNYMQGNDIICKVYGSSKDKQNISISTNLDKQEEAPRKNVEDPSLPKGEENVLEKGRKEYIVSTYRIYKDASGKVLRQEKVLVSKYPKRQEVVAVGTKEVEVPVEPQEPETPEIPETPETPEKPEGDTSLEPQNPVVPDGENNETQPQ